MNPGNDPSAALASLLAILSRSTKGQQTTSSSQHHPSHLIEPIFPEGDILDTTQWIGIPTTQWYQPRAWQLPRPDLTIPCPPQITSPQIVRLPSPEVKRKRSPSPTKVTSFPSYSHALKYIIQQTQDEEFISSIRKVKIRQDNFETDLFEQRSRIARKYESKRKMNELLKSIGSQYTNEQVPNRKVYGLM